MDKRTFFIFIIIFILGVWVGFGWGAYSTAKFGIYVAEQVLDIKFKPEFITFLTSDHYKINRYASIQNPINESLFRQGLLVTELP